MTSEPSIDSPIDSSSEPPASSPPSWRRRSSGRDERVLLLPARPAAPAPHGTADAAETTGTRGTPSTAFVRRLAEGKLARQAGSFALIGVASTAAYVALYAALRGVMSATGANAVALLFTAIANTAANRRLTFAVQGREGLARDHAAGLLAFAIALLITSASLGALGALTKHPSRMAELTVLVAANALATLVRFLMLRYALRRSPERAAATATVLERIPR